MTSPAGIAADRRPFAAAGDPASRVQEARAEHAPEIAALYRAVYADKRPDDAVDHYPFPQFMNEVWLRSTIAGRTFRWLVATGDGTVVGSAVGVRLPEATSTGLAETCGVVVRPDFRRRGIGARLLTALERLIEGDFCLALAETRTADNGGWELFRRAGYVPLGFEPSVQHYYCFKSLNALAGFDNLDIDLLGGEHIGLFGETFDVIFLMGIIYHRISPLELLKDIHKALKPGGTLIIESQAIPGDEPVALFPEKTYAKAPGTYFVPTGTTCRNWLLRSGFNRAELFCSHPMSSAEQRRTDWMVFESYQDYISPDNPTRTVEGYPAPWRIFLSAVKT